MERDAPTGGPGAAATGPAAAGEVVAVVPLKALRHAKGRLEPALTANHRTALTAWMLERVLRACRGARGLADVLVVAGDAEAAGVARAAGATAAIEPRPGLAAAMALADRLLAGAGATLAVTADLPLATSASLEQVLAAAPDGPAVVVAESTDGGTSALLRRPPGVTVTRFGPASARAHLDLAARAGVPAVRLRVPALALDVDGLASLREAARRSPELAAWLRRRGLGPRAVAS